MVELEELLKTNVQVKCEGQYSFPKGNCLVQYCDFPTANFRCPYYKPNIEFPVLSLCDYVQAQKFLRR